MRIGRMALSLVLGSLSLVCAAPEEGLTEANAREKWAGQLCKQAEECDCEVGEDYDACYSDNLAFFHEWEKVTTPLDLSFDGDCLQGWLDRAAASECAAYPDSSGSVCEDFRCSFWHGDADLGAPCEPNPTLFATHCAQGLTCLAGACADLCEAGGVPVLGAGDKCVDGQQTLGVCEEGLLCNYAGDGTCVSSPDIGDACVGADCGAGAYCDEQSICTARVPEGDACTSDFQCKTLACHDEVCAAPEAFACIYLL